MAKIYLIRVYDPSEKLLGTFEARAGSGVAGLAPLRLAAGAGYRLEVIDPDSGSAPPRILLRRNGSSLELYLEDRAGADEFLDPAEESAPDCANCADRAAATLADTPPDVVVEGFYGPGGPLVHLGGFSVAGAADLYPTPERDGAFCWAELGAPDCGEDLSPAWLWLLLLGGAAAVGLAVAVADHDRGGGGGHQPEPEIPAQQVVIESIIDDQEAILGVIPNNGLTNDSTPTLTGTLSAALQAGEYLAIYRDGVLVGRASLEGLDASGRPAWSFTDDLGGQPDGPYSYTARVVNAAGGQGPESEAYSIILDATPPAGSIAINSYFDNVGPNQGEFGQDTPTDDATPLLLGSVSGLEAGDRVFIYLGGELLGEALLDGEGGWSFQVGNDLGRAFSGQLAEGTHVFTAVIQDQAGNQTSSEPFTLTVDLTPPLDGNSVAIIAYEDRLEPGVGDFGNGTDTNDPNPLLKGTVAGLQPGDVVLIFSGTELLGQAIVSGGSWTYQVNGLDLGSHTFRAVIADAAGNQGTTSDDFTLTVINPPPIVGNAVEITSYLDEVELNTGEFTSLIPTNDPTPTLKGVVSGLNPGDYILIYQDGVLLSGQATLGSNGAWTYEITTSLAEGGHTFVAVIANDAGGEGTRSLDFNLIVDLSPPDSGNAVAITHYTDDVEPNVGNFPSESYTNDVSPVLHGTASGLEPGDIILIYEGATLLGGTRVTRDGSWAFPLENLGEGSHTFTAVIADAAGNRGTASEDFTLIVDTSPPNSGNAVQILGYNDDEPNFTGYYDDGRPTNDASPELVGSVSGLQPGDVVLIFSGSNIGGVPLGTATTDGLGGWTFQLYELADGSHTFTAVIADAAGNRGSRSDTFTLVVDTDPPLQGNAVEIIAYRDEVDPNSGDFSSGVPTNDPTPLLLGTVSGLQPGDQVWIYRDGVFQGVANLERSVNWSFEAGGLTEGQEYRYTAKIVDAAGNEGTESGEFVLVLDVTPPSDGSYAIAITGYEDDREPNTGIFGLETPTNDASPLLRGTVTGLQEGDVVLIFRGTDFSNGVAPLGRATVVNGVWTFQVTEQMGLSEGPNEFTAVVADAAGNRGVSANGTVLLDTQPPTGGSLVITSYEDDQEPNTGDFDESVPTNDTTPLIKGTFTGLDQTAGEYILVYHGSFLVGRATLSGDSNWEIQVTEALDEGVHVFTAVICDAAGNQGSRSNNFLLTVDTSPPLEGNSVAITAYYDDLPLNTGDFGSGVPTNDTTPLLKGTASGLQPGDKVHLYQDGSFLTEVTVNALGEWEYQLGVLAEGEYLYQARIVDAAGNQGTASDPFTLIVDLRAPDYGSVSIDVYIDQQEPNVGEFGQETPTNDASPILKGRVSGLIPGDVVLIYQGGVLLGQATLDGSGGWTYQLEGLAAGSYTYTARITDAAGNPGTTSNDFILIVEFPPTAGDIVIVSYYDDVGVNTGNFGPGTSTDDTLPLLQGTVDGLAAGEYILIYDGDTPLGRAVADGSGGWSFQVNTDLAPGDHFFTAVITAANGTEGTRSIYFKLTVDLEGPTSNNSVAITVYLDDVDPQEGEFGSGVPTNDPNPLLRGTVRGLEPGGEILIYQNGVYLGKAVIDNQSWSYQLGGLSDGATYTYQAFIADAAGNPGTASNEFILIVDTSPPVTGNAVAITSYYDDTPLNVGYYQSDTPTNDPSPLLLGTVSGLQAGDVLRIYRDGVFLGLADLDGAGGWTYQVYGLTEGTHTFTARITDAAGNLGTESAEFAINVDLTPPTTGNSVGIDSYLDDFEPNTGSFPSGQPTNDASPLLQGTVTGLEPGDVVLIYLGETLLGPAVVQGNAWTYQLSGLAEGSYTYTAIIADAAGNRGTASNPFVVIVDRTPPTEGNAVAITAYIDDQEPQVGEFPSSTPTNDTSPLLKGTVSGLQDGDVVRIYRGSAYLGTASLDGRGGWTYQVTGLAAGVYVFTAIIADAAGNEGTRSGEFSLTVDREAPASTASLNSISEDTGLLDDDFITADQTLVFNIATNGVLAAGDRVQISLDNGATWQDAVYNQSSGLWEFDNTATTLDEGSYAVLTRVVDAAGNAGADSTQTVIIDLSSPDTVPTVTHFSDNFGPYQNAVLPSGTYTDDKTPELHGSLSAPLLSGERLAVYQGSTFLGYASVTDQSWSFTDTRGSLENGKAYVYRTAVVNATGNLGEASNEFEVRIDDTDSSLAPTVGENSDRSFSTALMLDANGQWVLLSDQTVWQAQDRKNYSGDTLSLDGLSGHAGGSSYGGIAFGSWTFADYDKDGYMDIFVTDNVHAGRSLTAYRGGADGYTPSLILSNNVEGTQGTPNESHLGTVISLDINGDGYIDVIIGDSGNDSSTFLLNKGTGASGEGVLAGQWYGMGHNYGQAAGALNGLIVDHELSGVDLDNNGTIDFVAHAYNTGGQIHSLSVLLNSGETSTNGSNWSLSQVFERIFNYSGVGDDTYLHTISLTWGDFNGDGYMDLFMGQSQDNGTRTSNNLIFYNNGDGTLSQPQVISDTLTGAFSLALDWNCDGRMDIIEVPEYGIALSQSQIWLNSGSSLGQAGWNRQTLAEAGTVNTGAGRANLAAYSNATGLTAVDYDWDGDIDVIISTQGSGPSLVVNNPNTPDYGTALHLRILAGDGSVSFYGNTVMLYDADGNFVASQIINPQSGMGQNDSSALVHLFRP